MADSQILVAIVLICGFFQLVLYYAYPLPMKKKAWWRITSVLSFIMAIPLFLLGKSWGGIFFLMMSFVAVVIGMIHWWKSNEFN